MAISKQIVQMMDGSIGVVSEPNKGSTFWFTAKFENSFDPERDSLAAEKEEAKSLGELKILVVDDNPVNQEVAIGKLKRLGISAVAVKDGLDALDEVKKNKYDLVLMDCRMPRMNGFEATMEIRRLNNEAKNIKIIAMTASGETNERQKCFDSGMNDYLLKPLSDLELNEALQRHLSILIPNDLVLSELPENETNHPLSGIIEPGILNSFIEIQNAGDENFVMSMVNIFINHADVQLGELERAFLVRDLPLIKNKSHLLRGSSGNIGMLDLYQEFVLLEKMIEKDWVEAENILERIIERFKEIKNKVSYLSEIGD